MIQPTNLTSIDNETIAALSFIEKSTINFHLTGSRFFGNYTHESDYDFFVADSKKVENLLIKNKFSILSEDRYQDSNTVKVYRRGKVDVQLSIDFDLKLKVNTWLKNNPAIYSIINQGSKRFIREKWTALLQLATISGI